MLKFSKANIVVGGICILAFFLLWIRYPEIKIFPSDTNSVTTDTNTATWESGSGVKIDITMLNKEYWKKEYSKKWFSAVEELLDNYTVIILEIGLQPKVETLFIDIPAGQNTKIITAEEEVLSPLNDDILEKYYQQDSLMKQYLQVVYEETMSNNSPFTLYGTLKKGILVFPKCNDIKTFEFNIFNSEADIGRCQINFN